MDPAELPLTGTCDIGTTGRRNDKVRRVEIWYVIVDGQITLTGTPGPRNWLANLHTHPEAVLHLRGPNHDLPVVAHEVTDQVQRRRIAETAWQLQPWYAEQPFSIDDWVADAPMVVLVPNAEATGEDRSAPVEDRR